MDQSEVGGTGSSPPREQGDPEEQRGRLLRRSTTVSAFIGLGVVAGFLVDVLIVARFGLGTETDAFFGAYTVPLILITSMAAVQPVLISLLAGYRHEKSAFSILLNTAGLIGMALAAAGALLARPLVNVTMPGFAPATAELATQLARILFARVPAAAVSEICRSELYVKRRFGLASFSNAIPSLVTLTLLLISGSESSIEVVAYGFVVGAMGQALLLAGLLFGPLNMPYRWTWRRAAPILRQAGQMVLAPLTGVLLRQGVTLAERFLGSFLPAGSVTALSYANRLNAAVAGIFFNGIVTASLPSLADRWRQGATKAARTELEALLKLVTYVAVPVGLAVSALSVPLVRLFFERGQVDSESALLMGVVLGAYSLSLPSLGPFRAVQTFFYAIQDTRPVVFLLGGLAMLTIGLDLILVWPLGAVGLALAFALSCGIMMTVGMVWLARRVRDQSDPSGGSLHWRRLADAFWRLGLASVAMAGTMFVSSWWLEAATLEMGRWGLLLTLLLSSLAGLAVFVAVGAILRLDAISILWTMAREKWADLR